MTGLALGSFLFGRLADHIEYPIRFYSLLEVGVGMSGLLCTWREVYAGFRDFSLGPGEEIIILGAGPVGLSFVKFGLKFCQADHA